MKLDPKINKNLPKRRFSIIPVVLLFILWMASCKDDDEVTLDKIQLLTSAPWIFESVNSGDALVDALFNAFLSGATYTFSTDGTYVASFPQIDPNFTNTGTWEFNAMETSLIIDKGTVNEENWTILILDGNQLKFSLLDTDTGDTIEMLFKH